MNVYRVEIVRDDGWWVISVPELRGVFSQARRRDEVEAMARDAVALYLDVPENSFELSIHEVHHYSEPISH